MKAASIKVQKSETIGNLKAEQREEEGDPEYFLGLLFTGELLWIVTRTLLSILFPTVKVRVYVKLPSEDKIMAVKVKSSDTIQKIKSIILAKIPIQVKEYSLYHAGKVLEDNRTLASLNIPRKVTLQMVPTPPDVLPLCLETPSKDMIKLEVKLLHTVLDMKRIVEGMVDFPVENWDFVHSGNRLENFRILACYDIKEDDVLKMVPAEYQIFVKTWGGRTVTVNVNQLDTIGNVRARISPKNHAPYSYRYLTYGGKPLKDCETLSFYNIRREATLFAYGFDNECTRAFGSSIAI